MRSLVPVAVLVLLALPPVVAAPLLPDDIPAGVPQRLEPPQVLRTPPPSGPAVPTIQDGLGPGSALHQYEEVGDSGGYICTAGFILRDPATSTYYLSTAGHCLVLDSDDPAPYTGADNPEALMQEIEVCVSGCINNAVIGGSYVSIAASPSHHPITFAQSGGVGLDFGIVEIPASLYDEMRPWMPQWGGPTGTAVASSGDLMAHYGHGSYCCPVVGAAATRSSVDQGRLGISLGSGGAGAFQGLGHITGGDSGSAISLATTDAGRGVQGTEAVGVLTHSLGIEVSLPLYIGTTMEQGLAMVRDATGLSLELVLQDDPLGTVPAPVYTLAIESPADGARLRQPGEVKVSGTAAGTAAIPEGAQVQVAVDDPGFAEPNRLDVEGIESWEATWTLDSWSVGSRDLHVRLVDAAGKVLASASRTVTVDSAPGAAPPPSEEGGGDPGSDPGTPAEEGDGGEVGVEGDGGDGRPVQKAAPKRDTPAAPLVLLLAVLVGAVAIGRRRK